MMIEGNSAEAVAVSYDDAATAIVGFGDVGDIDGRGRAIVATPVLRPWKQDPSL